MSDDARIRVRLDLHGLKFDFRGDRAFFERTLEPVFLRLAGGGAGRSGTAGAATRGAEPANGVAADAAPEEAPASRPSGYVPPSDLWGVFQRQLDPVKLEEDRTGTAGRVAAYAFFLWNYERKESFREEEVAGCFRAEGRELPEDAADVFQELARRRILAPGVSEHTWSITPRGVSHVRSRLLSA